MGEFGNAMRRHGAAGVEIRIDERGQSWRRFDRRIELDAQLPQERQVRPRAGRNDNAIDIELEWLTAEQRRHHGAIRPWRHALDGKGRQHL